MEWDPEIIILVSSEGWEKKKKEWFGKVNNGCSLRKNKFLLHLSGIP